MATERRPIRAFTLISVCCVVLAAALIGALLVPLAHARQEVRDSRRIASLAEADKLLFQTDNALRLSRNTTQTAYVAADDAAATLQSVRADSDGRASAMFDQLAPILGPDEQAKAQAARAAWQAVTPPYQAMLSAAGKPTAQRQLSETSPWFNAIGAVVAQLDT
jgi:hypothetical protein